MKNLSLRSISRPIDETLCKKMLCISIFNANKNEFSSDDLQNKCLKLFSERAFRTDDNKSKI